MTPFETLLPAFAFLFGIIIGSFLNVVLYRTEKGAGFGGRSHCLECDITLATRDLVPVLSYFYLRGRCRNCSAPISIQYPIVELSMGFLSLGLYLLHLPLVNFFILFVICAYLLLITVYDIRHTEIPNSFAYGFCYFALLYTLLPTLGGFDLLRPAITLPPQFFAGPILFLAFFLMWDLSGERAIGLADAKVALGIGWLLGIWGGLSAIMIAVWSGALVGVLLLVAPQAVRPVGVLFSLWKKGKKTKTPKFSFKSEIPFAPFLVAGTLIVLFGGVDAIHFFI